ncbi:MAG: exodeoxyribonuclease VII large subunit [Clostridiaceae bacterium]|nr:exodeoxyribonuclease VII large subunit [Clostridiaceae bacterium]
MNSLTVRELTAYIKQLVDSDMLLSNLCVTGEISNFKHHSSGHMYFSLKDQDAVIRCVMFRTYNARMRFMPEEGMKVIVRGYVSVYAPGGTYQLYAEDMQPDGTGSLYLAFEQLKQKLEALGWFAQERKKPIPRLPRAIGIVTSPTGAVIRDMLNILQRRYPNIRVVIYPSAVQGIEAPAQLIRGIRYFNEAKNVDVIIIGRGGGSIEDLWPFNDEGLARAIYESSVPVISAVGHETDFSISDFVADLRAPTPSAAAELVVPEKTVLKERLMMYEKSLTSSLLLKLKRERERIAGLSSARSLTRPFERVDTLRQQLDGKLRGLALIGRSQLERHRSALGSLAGRLDALSPLTVLSRGYAIVQKEDGSVVKSIRVMKPGDRITVRVADGRFGALFEEALEAFPDRMGQ